MEPEPPEIVRWAVPPGLVAVSWALTAAAAAWWLTASGAMDRVFIGVVMLALIAFSCYATFVRPRLRADAEGITVRTLAGASTWPWRDVRVRVRRHQRLGRTVELLEIDTPERHGSSGLVVLTRLDLGQDVVDVAEQLERLRERG